MSASEAIPGDVAWIDGRFLPRHELLLPVGDAGFVLGAAAVEQLRTIRGRLFLPGEHACRLAGTLDALGIRPPLPLADVFAAADTVAAHNHRLLSADASPTGDLGLVVFVTPGDHPPQHDGLGGPARVAIHSFPLAFAMWADAYERGIALRSVAVRQVPEACWPVHVKVRSRLHYYLADREAATVEPGARAVLAHLDGRISETSTSNIAMVLAGAVVTPPAADALPGVSLGQTARLATAAGIGWEERSLTAADLAAADEILLTSTPSCILPATRFDGRPVGSGRPGPVYRRLLEAWSAAVDLDVPRQARLHARPTGAAGHVAGAAER